MKMLPGTASSVALPLVDHKPARVRVQVISKHPIIRTGIQALLAAHSDVVTCPAGPADGPADVVIYDVIGLHLCDGQDIERPSCTTPAGS